MQFKNMQRFTRVQQKFDNDSTRSVELSWTRRECLRNEVRDARLASEHCGASQSAVVERRLENVECRQQQQHQPASVLEAGVRSQRCKGSETKWVWSLICQWNKLPDLKLERRPSIANQPASSLVAKIAKSKY
jgi:hypothetical protein